MPAKAITWGLDTPDPAQVTVFVKNTKEEVQDLCRMAYGSLPMIVSREGIPSPIYYKVEEM